MQIALMAYVTGVLIGLWRVDGRPLARLGVAAAWPLGAAAALITANLLLLAAAVLFPRFGAGLVAAILVAWWLLA